MGTGLTYVSIYDSSVADPNVATVLTAFSSYDEAYEWGRWFILWVGSTQIKVLIKTYSPNDSGYWELVSGVAVFTLYE